MPVGQLAVRHDRLERQQGGNWIRAAANVAGQVANYVGRSAKRQRTNNTDRNQNMGSSRVNDQYRPTSTVYRRRPAPKRVKRRARAFRKRVDSVMTRNLATNTLFRTGAVTFGNATFGELTSNPATTTATQQWGHALLYPFKGAAQTGGLPSDDISVLWGEIRDQLSAPQSGGLPVAASGVELGNAKVLLDSAVLDVNIAARFPTDGTTAQYKQVFITLYEVIARKSSTNEGINISQLMQVPQGKTTTLQPAHTTYGVSAFDISDFCQNFLITKVREIQLQPAQDVSFQLKMSKNITMSYDKVGDKLVADSTALLMPGLTRGYVFSVTGVPDFDAADDSPGISLWKVIMTVSKKYTYRLYNNVTGSLSYQ